MIQIDYSKNSLFDSLGIQRLKDSYMMDGEKDPQERFAFVSEKFASNPQHAQRLYNYSSSHWLSYSTPILSFGRSKKGLPISCYLNYIEDTAEGLVDNLTETNWLSMLGGGVGVHMGIRGVDEKSTGLMPHIKTYESSCQAYRQGRCYMPGTEVLTMDGWKAIETISLEDIIACTTDKGYLEWHKPTETVAENYSGNMIQFYNENRGIDFSVTEDHSMVIERKSRTQGWKGELLKIRASEVPQHNEARFVLSTINPHPEVVELSNLEKLLIAFQADGHKNKNNDTEFHFSKDRKISRIKNILKELNYTYSISSRKDGSTVILIKKFYGDKEFSWIKLDNISSNKARAMLEEIAEWDGTRSRDYSITYSNTNKNAADKVHALAIIAGRAGRMYYRDRDETRQRIYYVYISDKPYFNLEKLQKNKFEYDGMVYCCVVPTGRILVRNNGVAMVCGNTRRGSYAIYTDISHPDIIQFLEMRKPTGDPNLRALHLNHGINITDKFMNIITECMKDENYDDSWELIQPNTGKVVEVVSAKELWGKILEIRANTGEPYLWFIDTANENLPEFQKAAGLKNNGSNLCVAPETSILTDSGYKEIRALQNTRVKVWNGIEFSEVEIVKTGENQKLVSVVLDNGMSIDCTLYHKFYVKNHYDKKEVEVKASDLKVGDKLIRAAFPTIEGSNKLELAYQNGFFTGDGCFFNNENIVYLYGNKRELINYFLPYSTRHSIQEAQDREVLIIPNLQDKFFVPNAEYSIISRLEWLAGILDADSVVCKNGNSQTIQLSSVNFEFLQNVQRMLHTLGTASTIKIMHLEGIKKLPKNDGTGELGDYKCKTCYRLLISGMGIVQLLHLGLKCNRLELSNHIPNREATRLAKVLSIEDRGRISDTYCFNEPLQHKGIFNGILTGNCSEISLATSKDRTAVCCLSSVNLKYYDVWKDDKQFLPDVLEMLDNVIQYFILNAPNEISRAKYSAYRERSVGIGVLGFHAYLQSKMIPFESALAVSINKAIFKHIREQLDTKNTELAIQRGPCPDAADHNVMVRNAHVMAIAPTASASIIMGNTSPSTEPYAANVYRQDTISGAFINKTAEFNAFVNNYAKENGLDASWVSDQWESIIANKGSCQHLEWMTDYEKEVFKTAREIGQEWIVSHAADRQPYIDQAQSVNLYIHPRIPIPRLHMLHYMAWKAKLKGLYYCRSGKVGEIDKMSQKIKRVRIEDEVDINIDTTKPNNYIHDAQAGNTYWTTTESSICLACE